MPTLNPYPAFAAACALPANQNRPRRRPLRERAAAWLALSDLERLSRAGGNRALVAQADARAQILVSASDPPPADPPEVPPGQGGDCPDHGPHASDACDKCEEDTSDE